MLSKKIVSPSGIAASWGTPTRPTAPPGRAMLRAVTVDSFEPHALETECAPNPPVSSRTRSTASSPRSLTTSVAPNSFAMRDAIGVPAEDDHLLGAEPPGSEDAAEADRSVADAATLLPSLTFALTAAW